MHYVRGLTLTNTVTSAEQIHNTVPEIIDPVFAKTSQNARFLFSEFGHSIES